MIDIRELRIGNYISYFSNNELIFDKIKSIYFDDDDNVYKFELESGKFNLYHITIKGIKPIPITEELLLKCGFEVNNGYCTRPDVDCISNSMSMIFQNDEFTVIIEWGEDVLCSFKYLHQLQNYFYIISEGKELEINF